MNVGGEEKNGDVGVTKDFSERCENWRGETRKCCFNTQDLPDWLWPCSFTWVTLPLSQLMHQYDQRFCFLPHSLELQVAICRTVCKCVATDAVQFPKRANLAWQWILTEGPQRILWFHISVLRITSRASRSKESPQHRQRISRAIPDDYHPGKTEEEGEEGGRREEGGGKRRQEEAKATLWFH